MTALPPLTKSFKHLPLFRLNLKLILFTKVIWQRGKEQNLEGTLFDIR